MGMNKAKRDYARAGSNNQHNPNKNICALAVTSALGVAGRVRYLHVRGDTERAIRTKYSVRSCRTAIKGKTVHQVRKAIPEANLDAFAFIVYTERHVLLLKGDGGVYVDTDPREGDRRVVQGIKGIYLKPKDHEAMMAAIDTAARLVIAKRAVTG